MSHEWREVSTTRRHNSIHSVTAMEMGSGVMVKNTSVYMVLSGDQVAAASESMVFLQDHKLIPTDNDKVRMQRR